MTEIDTNATLTRRGAIAAAGATAFALAAVSLTGCSSNSNEASDNKNREFLPIGSVVKLASYENTDIIHAVISRRPHLSKRYTTNSSGVEVEESVNITNDYALVAWPVGIINDINKIYGDIVLADSTDIKEILFIGYEDDIEKEAQTALTAGKASNLANGDALEDISVKLLKSYKKEGN